MKQEIENITNSETKGNLYFYNTPFEMKEVVPPSIPDYLMELTYTANGLSIQEAINTCSKHGGGTIIIPSGNWFSKGPIHLRSNIKLVLEKGAVIEFSNDPNDYLPVVFTRWEGIECYNYSPLIYGKDLENIAIVGEGRLIGNGAYWHHWKQLQGKAATELYHAEANNIPVKERVYGSKQAALRPSFLQTINCKNVHLQGLTIEDSPQWTLHPVYCENVLIQDLTIHTLGHNTDGLNPDSCKNVVIEGCSFTTGDDCIAINSGMNEDGLRVGKPCENIIIRNCTMNHGHGGIVIGSGMSGGVKNIYAKNNIIHGGMWGIRMKSMRGRAGYIRDIWFEDISISNTSHTAIHITMFYEYTTVLPLSDTPSDCFHIYLKNIHGENNKEDVIIKGLPEHNIKDVTLHNINLMPHNRMRITDVEELYITRS